VLILSPTAPLIKLLVMAYFISPHQSLSLRKARKACKSLNQVYMTEPLYYQLQLWEAMGGSFDPQSPIWTDSDLCVTGSRKLPLTQNSDSALTRAKSQHKKKSEKQFHLLELPSIRQAACGYFCNTCKKLLFSDDNLIPHVESLRESVSDISDTPCLVYGVEPLRWMNISEKASRGSIRCYDCNKRIGSYSWKGLDCNCEKKIAPSFHILKDHVYYIRQEESFTGGSLTTSGSMSARLSRKNTVSFLKKIVPDNFSKRSSLVHEAKDKGGEKEIKDDRPPSRRVSATCFAELPKDLQKYLARGKVPPNVANENWFTICQLLRFTQKVAIKNVPPDTAPVTLEIKQETKKEIPEDAPRPSKWKLEGIKILIAGTNYEHEVLDVPEDIKGTKQERELVYANYLRVVIGNVNPCTFSLTSPDIEDFFSLMEAKYASPGNPKDLFKILERSGTGGFGRVFLGREVKTRKRYAIKKIPHVSLRDRKTNWKEIEILSSCLHKNIVKYHSCYVLKEEIWIIMEFMEGGSLKEASAVHTFNESQIAYIAKEALQALQFMHQNGLVHRDLKPGNIMLTVDGDIKLIDFGLCERTEVLVVNPRIVGSPYWMPPEILLRAPYNEKADVWSLGCTLLQLVDPRSFDLGPMPKTLLTIATQGRSFTSDKARSSGLENFISSMLVRDLVGRASVDQLLEHSFLSKADTRKALKNVLSQIFVKNVMGQVPGF